MTLGIGDLPFRTKIREIQSLLGVLAVNSRVGAKAYPRKKALLDNKQLKSGSQRLGDEEGKGTD